MKPGLTVAESEIHGFGIFAIKLLPKNTELGVILQKRLPCEPFATLMRTAPDFQERDLRIAAEALSCVGLGHELLNTPLRQYLNHSDKPNARFSNTSSCIAVVSTHVIHIGEEVTVSYTDGPWYLEKPQPNWVRSGAWPGRFKIPAAE